ncbi:uncharacterized protein LOC123542351 isoform X2 [Mercenaria mercenaria]|uniref:uncharacterized protein LOC123542351 isoform X2 n=1 Tax=Mercenaria mercenaria TaxID=6596 RepID=UPI00234E91E1|nr:uncharacterized protein LOC123542351 isoform X2 [Mercenaria mercenaria]
MGNANFSTRCLQKRGLNILIKFLLLTVGASMMFTFMAHHVVYRPSSAVSRLGPAFMLINKAGNSHLDYFEEFAESPDEEKIVLMNKMRESMKSFMHRCTKKKAYCKKFPEQQHILTLFTTWVYEKEKFHINNKTLFNWRTLPNVNLVVFTNSTGVKYYSAEAGFQVLPIIEEASGAPVLPAMFGAVMKKFQSEFYGFANGDILFTKTLVDTLEHVLCSLGQIRRQNGILIVGRRVNVPARLVTDKIAMSWKQLDRISHSGSLFQSDAEDYFITDKSYPWHKFLPVAIGRRAYDNWVVAFSRYHNITVIDASESIQCLHQTLESRGNFEGLEKGRYNIELIDQLRLPFSPYSWGRTLCAGMKSWTNLCGEIVLSESIVTT